MNGDGARLIRSRYTDGAYLYFSLWVLGMIRRPVLPLGNQVARPR